MAINIRKSSSLFEAELMTAYNVVVDSKLSTEIHRDKTSKDAGTTASPSSTPILIAGLTTDQTTCNALANELKNFLGLHFVDGSAHTLEDDSVVLDGYAVASTLDTANLLANAMKIVYNAHMAKTDVHLNDDATNTVTAADSDDLAKLKTLLADLKTQVNAHAADAGAIQRYIQVPA